MILSPMCCNRREHDALLQVSWQDSEKYQSLFKSCFEFLQIAFKGTLFRPTSFISLFLLMISSFDHIGLLLLLSYLLNERIKL